MVAGMGGAGKTAEDAASEFDAFCAASSRRLLGQIYAMCGDMGDAQDCLQEAYLRAWQHWSLVSTYDDPASWVRQAASRLAVNRWHRARNSLRAWARHGPTPEVGEPSADSVLLARALQGLPVAQREAIVLHHLVGLSIEQIASRLESPAGTIKARLARGRTRLAEILSEEAPG